MSTQGHLLYIVQGLQRGLHRDLVDGVQRDQHSKQGPRWSTKGYTYRSIVLDSAHRDQDGQHKRDIHKNLNRALHLGLHRSNTKGSQVIKYI